MAKISKKKVLPAFPDKVSLQHQVDVLTMENSILKDAYFQLRLTKSKLAESEAKYQSLVESANEIVFIAQDNRIKYANKRAFDIFGYTAKEIASRSLTDFIYPEDKALVLGHYQRRLKGKKEPANYEFRVIDKQKQIRWVLISPALVQWEGKPAILTLMTDVSELKKAEDTIKESESKFRSVVEHITDVVFSADSSGKVTFITPNVSSYGYALKDVVGHSFTDFIHPEDVGRVATEFKATMKGGRTTPSEFRMRRKDGNYVPVEELDDLITEKGEPVRLVGTFRDITERKRSEEKIKEGAIKFSSIFEGGADGILIANVRTKRFTMANSTMCRFLGYRKEEFFRMSLPDIHPKADFPWILKNFIRQAKGTLKIAQDTPCIRRDGSIVYADIATTPFKLGGNDFLIGFFRDCTERRKANQVIKESKNFLDKVINTMSDPVFVKDDQSRFLLINDSEIALTGRTREDQIGKTNFESYPKKQSDLFLKNDREVLRTGKESISEEQITDMNGKILTVVTKKTRYVDTSGKKFIVGVMRDITERKKEEEEIKFKNVILSTQQEVSIDGILIVGESGKVISANQRFFEIWGIPKNLRATKDDAIILRFVKAEMADPKEFLDRVLYLYKHKLENSHEEIVLKDGRVFDRHSFPMLGTDKEYFGRVWYFRDITERKRAENLLHDSESRYRMLFSSMQSGFALHEIVCDKKGKPIDYRFLEVNPAFETITGLRSAKLIGKTVREVLPGTENSWIETYGKVALTGKSTHFENYASELRRYYEVLAYSPKRGTFATLVTDITDRKQSEKKLKESEEKFRVLTESATDQIFMVDRRYTYLSVNKSLAADFKTTVDKMVGKTISDFFPKKIAAQLIKNIDLVFNSGRPKTNFEEVIEIQDQTRYINTSLHPIKDPQGVVVGVAGISRDNTEIRKTQLNLNKFEIGLQRSSQAIFITDPKGHIQFVNPAFQRIYGYSPKEVLGKTPRLIKSGVLSPKQYKDFWKTLLSKHNVEGEIINKTKDGRILNIFGSANPIVDKSGTIIGYLGIQSDITEQRKIENALKDQQSQYKTLVESLPACIKLFDTDGELVSVNAHGREEHGLQKMSDEEIRKWDFLECIEKQDHDKVKKGLVDALKGKMSSFIIHHTHTHAQGGSCFSTLVPVRSEGKVKFVLFTSLDVTEQQTMQNALKESEERYRDIVENSTEMIHSVDVNNRILFANKREYELLGYTPEDLIGMPLSKIYSKDLLLQVEQGFERLKKEGTLYISHSKLVRKNGDLLEVEVHSIAIYDKDGKFIRTRSILIDITQRQKIEEELQKKVEQMEFMGRANLKRYRQMLEMEKEISELKRKLAEGQT